MNRGYGILYPNLYIILTAESAISSKSTAIELAIDLLLKTNPKAPMFSQKQSSPESMINFLALQFKEYGTSSGYIVADELASFIGATQQDLRIVAFLTQVYGCKEIYNYHSIMRGIETCNKLYINLLAGTTVDWVRHSMPSDAVAGGFAGRILFISDRGLGQRVAHPKVDDAKLKDVVEDIRSLWTLKGEFVESPEAYKWYETWYEECLDPNSYPPLLRPYAGRKGETVFKIAMILSAMRGDSLIIEKQDLEDAVRLLAVNEPYLYKIFESIEATTSGKEVDKLINFLRRRGGSATISEIAAAHAYCMNADTIRKNLDTLELANKITRELGGKSGKALVISLTKTLAPTTKIEDSPHHDN